ncbi:cytochrome c peroxidase [Myxococcus sp. Y35]|uniref:cytochrome c peroxidase n=1 Tax=Pseudomyxococcus flavus TaxID=3115648 RepID=UPI003CF5AA79
MLRKHIIVGLTGAMALGGLPGCSDSEPEEALPSAEAETTAAQAARLRSAAEGKRLFSEPLPHTNGRSCATCHVLDDGLALSPANVAARLATRPDDPLFNRLDADDPTAETLTFENLKRGLVRVILPLPANMDVIDIEGKVITPADRKISVWRAVPSVADTALTAPFQFDGREATLEEQAQSAITSHSEGGTVAPSVLRHIADFQRNEFTSGRARFVAGLLDFGVPMDRIPTPEDFMWLTPQEQRGREVFQRACEGCHGGAATNQIVDAELHQQVAATGPVLKPDGNIVFTLDPVAGPVPVFAPRANSKFVNAGFGTFTYLGQLGLFPAYNASLELPRYRFRFYTDATRQHAVTELPPIPVTASGDPLDPTPALDAHGLPIVGPNLIPQWFTTDPGRALITGNPEDFEAFDLPPLRGIAKTAPYFHDHAFETLSDVVNAYSQLILPLVPALALPPIHPSEVPGGGLESLSAREKQDLLRFLERL